MGGPTAIAKCALRGEQGIPEAASDLIRKTLGRCLPLRLPKGAGLLVLAQAEEKTCGLFTVTSLFSGWPRKIHFFGLYFWRKYGISLVWSTSTGCPATIPATNG